MRTIATITVIACLWLGAHALRAEAFTLRSGWPPEAETMTVPTPAAAKILSLGYRELAADIFWIRAVVYYGASHAGDADFRYLRPLVDDVIALDPRFRRVYEWAALAVTYTNGAATQAEYRTSVKYLEAGIKAFPDDWQLWWLAGLHYWNDIHPKSPAERKKLREKGARYIETAMHKPNTPPQVAGLAASLRTKLGQREEAIRELREMILTTRNKKARKRMLDYFRTVLKAPALAREIAAARKRFVAAWQASMPLVPPGLYVILGNKPSPVIDLSRLATPRDLFGADTGRAANSTGRKSSRRLYPPREPPASAPTATGSPATHGNRSKPSSPRTSSGPQSSVRTQ